MTYDLLLNVSNYTQVGPVTRLEGVTDLELIRNYCQQYATWELTMMWLGAGLWAVTFCLMLAAKKYPVLDKYAAMVHTVAMIVYAGTFFAILGARVFA
jgi:hypothetical protein